MRVMYKILYIITSGLMDKEENKFYTPEIQIMFVEENIYLIMYAFFHQEFYSSK